MDERQMYGSGWVGRDAVHFFYVLCGDLSFFSARVQHTTTNGWKPKQVDNNKQYAIDKIV
jgi:hypothetical protein